MLCLNQLWQTQLTSTSKKVLAELLLHIAIDSDQKSGSELVTVLLQNVWLSSQAFLCARIYLNLRPKLCEACPGLKQGIYPVLHSGKIPS